MNLQAENPLGLAKQTDKPLAQKIPKAQMPRADSKAEKRLLVWISVKLEK